MKNKFNQNITELTKQENSQDTKFCGSDSDLTFAEKYQAILAKDTSFEGIFITAVRTTGIFCRPSCTAKKPKPENIVFYNSICEAIHNGYRPCKVCSPMEQIGKMPEPIRQIIEELNNNPFIRIKDYDIRNRQLEPSYLRRWFLKHYNMTFHSYQRMLRINTAFNKINHGSSITDAAYDVGYNSLSGFNDRFRDIFGNSGKNANKNVINITQVNTPLGPMYAGATHEGICLLEFTSRRMLETELKDLCKQLNAVILPGENQHLAQLKIQLAEYFEAKRTTFNLNLVTPGTKFQQAVWQVLQQIPYATTCSYKEQAIKLNNPNAVRAVANANGHNRISIIIPCHRVIGSNKQLTGYGGGMHRKKWLLDFEQASKTYANA